jgi:hypothetical protein
MIYRTILVVNIVLILMFAGCSNRTFSPLTPSPDQNPDNTNLLGAYTLNYDPSTGSVSITPDRLANVHFNVTSYLPVPVIKINSWDPVNQIINVDVTISNFNPFSVAGFDLRLIIYTDSIGHVLINDDNYTDLFDIAGGLPINPFKAYAKTLSHRIFAHGESLVENLQIKCPGANFNVRFAIEASYPYNCDEPYSIHDFIQLSEMYDSQNSPCELEVRVDDWQNDVSDVWIYCTEILGPDGAKFKFGSGNHWTKVINNVETAPAGTYNAVLKAQSTGSGTQALYDTVSITVSETPTGGFAYPVGYPDAAGYSLTEFDGQVWMNYRPPYGYHLGEDYTAIGGGDNDCGDPVYASADGTVTLCLDNAMWGGVVTIRHDSVDGTGTMTTYYGHLDTMNVALNDFVQKGDVIGTIGNAHGRFWCHLHFEMRKGDHPVIGDAFSPAIVDEGPLGQINPSEFINEHYEP